jgi:hypothetical protein
MKEFCFGDGRCRVECKAKTSWVQRKVDRKRKHQNVSSMASYTLCVV